MVIAKSRFEENSRINKHCLEDLFFQSDRMISMYTVENNVISIKVLTRILLVFGK